MGARSALLDPAHVERGGPEVHLIPPEVDQLRGPEAVPVGHKNHRGVPVAPTVLPGSVHQPFDLGVGQILAAPQVAIGSPLGRDCSIYGGWRDQLQVPFGHELRAPCPSDCSYNGRSLNSQSSTVVTSS